MYTNLKIYFIVVFITLLIFGCKKDIEIKNVFPRDKIIAEVNDSVITLSDFSKKFKIMQSHYIDLMTTGKNILTKQEVLDRLIERKLILQEAKKIKLDVTNKEVNLVFEKLYNNDNTNKISQYEFKEEIAEQLLVEKVINNGINDKIIISDEEAKKYYNQHSEEFRQEFEVRASQILVATFEEANSIKSQLNRGEDFAKIAGEKSLSPDKINGGDLGYFGKADMPAEFVNTTFKLKIGQISDIIKTEYGYHILKVTDKKESGKVSLVSVVDTIKEKLKKERAEKEFYGWIRGLRERAKVIINEDFIKQ
ncbi:MAG: peptidylprolyl isomerase [Candidatus Firestonebacteria bacterium]